MTTEDRHRLQSDPWARNKFLKMFPQVKTELEECVQKLHTLADQVDQVHRGCTLFSMVASSAGAASETVNILGLELAPFIARGSFQPSAAVMGLGTITAVANVATTMRGLSCTGSAEAKARHLVSASKDKVKELICAVNKIHPDLPHESVNKLIDAMRCFGVRQHSVCTDLRAAAIHFITGGRITCQSVQWVQRIIGGTILAISRVVGTMGVITRGFSLVMDWYNAAHDSRHLQEDARAELAKELRQKAKMMERKLEELIEVHESLESGLNQ